MIKNISYLGLDLDIEIETIPRQKGSLEVEEIPESIVVKGVIHKGEDIYNLIGYDILMGIETFAIKNQ